MNTLTWKISEINLRILQDGFLFQKKGTSNVSWEVKCNRAQFFAYGQVILQVVDSIADLTDRYGIIQRVTLLFFMIQMDKR